VIALTKLYAQGVPTPIVKANIEELCGGEVYAIQVSRFSAQLDAMLQERSERPLDEITSLYVDARYEKVRESCRVQDAAVLVASGITPECERRVLDVR